MRDVVASLSHFNGRRRCVFSRGFGPRELLLRDLSSFVRSAPRGEESRESGRQQRERRTFGIPRSSPVSGEYLGTGA